MRGSGFGTASPMAPRSLVRLVVGLLGLLLLTALLHARAAAAHSEHAEHAAEPEEEIAPAPPPPPGSLYALPLTWKDDGGREATLGDWAGSPVLVTMFYTQCTTHICSVAFDLLRAVDKSLKQGPGGIPIVLVTLDHFDDPRRLRSYKEAFDLEDNWHFLVGSEEQTRQFTDLLGYDYWRKGPRHIIHSYAIYLLDAEGRVKRVIEWGVGADEALAMIQH